MAKKKMDAAKKKKIKIAVLASVGGLALIGGGVCIGYFGKETIKYFFDRNRDVTIDKVSSEYQAEAYVDPIKADKKWKYVSSSTEEVDDGDYEGQTISAHTFLLGNITNVPFYQSAWTKFAYENIGMKISYSDIKEESITNSESNSTEKTESSEWHNCTKINNKFEAEVSAGIGPVKASAKNTLDITMTKERSGSSSTKYVSNSSQTKGSVEALNKTSDYSINLNSSNGFKKGKYYRLSLQQTATEYLIVYEYADKTATATTKVVDEDGNEKDGISYELVSYLANPSDYTMVIEEAENPDEKPTGLDFDKEIVNQCIGWMQEQRKIGGQPECEFNYDDAEEGAETVRKGLLDQIFGGGQSIDSDIYSRDTEYRITDAGQFKNPCDVIPFETLFSSKYSPTFQELFNGKEESTLKKGYGYKQFKVTIECEVRQYDRGDNHIYLYNFVESNLPKKILWENNKDYNTKSWTKVRYSTDYIDEDEIRTSMESDADGKIVLRYDGSGKSDDDWGIRNLRVRVNISQ